MNCPAGKLLAISVLSSLTFLSSARTARATLTVFTDRVAWEAAVSGEVLFEDFEDDIPGTFTTPLTTAKGIVLESLGNPITALQILDSGLINGSQEIHVRDFGQQLSVSFPDTPPVYGKPLPMLTRAIGFDWSTAVEPWELHAGGEIIPIPASSQGFLGVVDDTGWFSSFVLTSSSTAQGGISIDNLAVENSVRVYTDRSSWEAASTHVIGVEDFESELAGVYTTPYTTANSVVFESLGAPITAFQIVAQGGIDGSKALHVRDFGNQLSVTLPSFSSRQAVGFDWQSPGEVWTCSISGREIAFPGNATGFLGVISAGGIPGSFVLTSSAQAQGGITIDNLAFESEMVAVERTTWGRLKSRY